LNHWFYTGWKSWLTTIPLGEEVVMQRVLFLFFMLGLSASALAIRQPPVGAPELRNAYASLTAVSGVPDGFKVNFNDSQVVLRSVTVETTRAPESGGCRVLVRINNQLAKVLKWEPPGGIVEDHPVSLTWNALLDRVGIQEPPGGIVFTPNDGLTISLESLSSDAKDTACSANVLVLGAVYDPATQAGDYTLVSPDQLRSAFFSLKADPVTPAEETLIFNDPEVLVEYMDVIPTQSSDSGVCTVYARINELLSRIQIREPPGGIAGIWEPPGGIVGLDGVTLAGIREPPVGIVFTPKDELKVQLNSVLTGKDKNSTCAADILILGTEYSNGQ
jgi:hypothetical protein